MKKILMPMMMFALFATSCGKGNNNVGGAGTPSANPGIFNSITTNTQGAASLGAKIDDYRNQFGVGQIYYYNTMTNWGTLANTGLNLVYKYTKSASSPTGSGMDCKTKWDIFYVCTSTSTSTVTSTVESRRVYNNNVDITAKGNELKAIINSANPLIPIINMGTSYRIQTLSGKQYVIDTAVPLQANPIGIMDSNGVEYLYIITEN